MSRSEINHSRQFFFLMIVMIMATAAWAAEQNPSFAPTCVLAQNGKPRLPIVIDSHATPALREAAKTLANYLGRISGATFDLTTADLTADTEGLIVAVASSYPVPAVQSHFRDNSLEASERYLLRTSPRRVLLVGATEMAVRHAVWDFLYRLGHRQFFPGNVWEIIPKI